MTLTCSRIARCVALYIDALLAMFASMKSCRGFGTWLENPIELVAGVSPLEETLKGTGGKIRFKIL